MTRAIRKQLLISLCLCAQIEWIMREIGFRWIVDWLRWFAHWLRSHCFASNDGTICRFGCRLGVSWEPPTIIVRPLMPLRTTMHLLRTRFSFLLLFCVHRLKISRRITFHRLRIELINRSLIACDGVTISRLAQCYFLFVFGRAFWRSVSHVERVFNCACSRVTGESGSGHGVFHSLFFINKCIM